MTPHFRADQRGDQVGLAAAVQRVGLEPAPAACRAMDCCGYSTMKPAASAHWFMREPCANDSAVWRQPCSMTTSGMPWRGTPGGM